MDFGCGSRSDSKRPWASPELATEPIPTGMDAVVAAVLVTPCLSGPEVCTDDSWRIIESIDYRCVTMTNGTSAEPGASSGVPVTLAQCMDTNGVRWSVVVAPLVGGHGRSVDLPDGAGCRRAELGALTAVLFTARLETRTKESMELAGSLVSSWKAPLGGHGESDLPTQMVHEHSSLHGTPGLKSLGLGFECLQGPWDPKGGELYRTTTKPWETAVEVGRCSDVQIV